MEEKENHVRVTLQMLYQKQLDNEKLLVETLAQLKALSDVPERLRAVEIWQAKTAWVEKLVYTALVAGVGAWITIIVRMVNP